MDLKIFIIGFLLSQIFVIINCDNVLENSRQLTGSKRDESDGILTSDPFLEAVHFWPLDLNRQGMLSSDLVTGSDIILMGGAKISNPTSRKAAAANSQNQGYSNYNYNYNPQQYNYNIQQQQHTPQQRDDTAEERNEVFNSYLDTRADGAYTIAGDFNGTCFSDPDECKLNGMTIYMWLKIDAKDLKPGRDEYILSTGGQSKKSRGFAFLWFHGKYVMVVSNKDHQWKLEIPKDKIKHDEWVQLTFVWNGNTDKLTCYQNGNKIGSTDGVQAERPEVKFTIMTIGRPNNAVNTQFMMKMLAAYIALWDKPLTEKEINKLFKLIKKKIDNTRRRSVLQYNKISPKQHFWSKYIL